jgi:RNase P subunit RPR2
MSNETVLIKCYRCNRNFIYNSLKEAEIAQNKGTITSIKCHDDIERMFCKSCSTVMIQEIRVLD